MRKIRFKKIVSAIMIALIFFSSIKNIVLATSLGDSSNLYSLGKCDYNVKFNFDGSWKYVICNYIVYTENSNTYPAYCMNNDLTGVDENGSYAVDLASIIEDNQIWRVVTNGFPYKSASDLGVENDFDAYFSTKHAIYSILYNRDPASMYVGTDERGQKIVNAIINLTNIGRNGIATQQSANVQINKVGGLTEETNYYSQTYSVTANVGISNYTITNTANMPNGGYISDLNGNAKTTFSGGENFKVMIPKDKMSSDLNIVLNVSGHCKTYPIFYGKSTIAGTQNYLITTDPYGDEMGISNLNVATNTGSITINKTDDETGKAVSGVTFSLYDLNGNVLANATTNEKGVATFSSLYQGNYTVKEISTNENYILNDSVTNANVEYNKNTNLNITNISKKGNITIYKVDKDNNKIGIGGVEFDLYSEELEKVIGNYTTDKNGEINIDNLRIGNYTAIEKSTNKWYNLAQDTNIKVEWDKTTQTTIENELKKGQIRIIKVDKDNNEVKLAGVKFEILDKNGSVLETVITDKNGEALTSKYAIRDYNELTIREKTTLESYALNKTPQVVKLEENQIKNITFENEKKKGQIKVIKVDEDNNEVKLAGVKFEIYNKENKLVSTLVTDENGEAVTDRLVCDDEYTIKEVETQKYYLLNNETQTVVLKQDEIKNIVFENEAVKLNVNVEKTGFVETQAKDNIFYNFKNIQNNSNVALDNFTWTDTLPTDALRVNKIYTGTWNENLEYSVWYKTNLNDYKMLVDGLSTNVNNEVDFTNLQLEENEYITNFEFRFGTVKPGFGEIESPVLYCDMLDGLGNGYIFTNKTKVSGNYLDRYVEDTDNWNTITYFKEIQVSKKLPRTGE